MSNSKSLHLAVSRVARFGGMVILYRSFRGRIMVEKLMTGQVRIEWMRLLRDGSLHLVTRVI